MTKNKINLRQNSRQILLSNNIPITKPRILVLEILLKNKGPLKVEEVIKEKNFEAVIPSYISLDEYKKNGGYKIVNQIRIGEINDIYKEIRGIITSIETWLYILYYYNYRF